MMLLEKPSSLFVGLLIIFNISTGAAQITQRSEVGIGVGTFNYTGDLVRSYNFSFSQPAATIFYRSNISKVVSFRASLTAGNLKADDKSAPIDAFATKRNASFDVFLSELSGVYEYHFLDWRDTKRRLRYTPYLFAGLALFNISGVPSKTAEYSNVQMSIPFGGGMKYVLNPKYYLSLEFGVRKTFFDYLDNVSDADISSKNYQYGNKFDTDTYYFIGFTITRTFYDIPCPTNPYR
ncbi:MAG: outer membrane beta-barrel protein [Cyclobacteriaceae bacterium]|nr:outer membrane beta-barrel protein [Cyclobacteriaceae bacterium]